MMYPLVGDLAGEGIPVTVSCRVLGFSTPRITPGAGARYPSGTGMMRI